MTTSNEKTTGTEKTTGRTYRFSPGPRAMALVANVPANDRAKVVEDYLKAAEEKEARLAEVEQELAVSESRPTMSASSERLLRQTSKVLDALTSAMTTHSELMVERFRKLDQMHLLTRALVGTKLTSGDQREQIFTAMGELIGDLQAHIDVLELAEADKAQVRQNEIMRMQQLLQEAASYQHEHNQQLEMTEMTAGGHER